MSRIAVPISLFLLCAAAAGCRKELPTDSRPPGARPEASPCEEPAALIVAKPENRVPDRYLVIYDDSVSEPDARTDALESRLEFESHFRFSSAVKGFVATLTASKLGTVRCEPYMKYVQEESAG